MLSSQCYVFPCFYSGICEKCRSDLNDSIHDTLILRRVETFKKLIDKTDSELTASELRQKHSLGMERVRKKLHLMLCLHSAIQRTNRETIF